MRAREGSSDLVVAEVEPHLQEFGEKCGASGDFPNRGYHFDERVHSHDCIRCEHESAGVSNRKLHFLGQ